MRRTFHADVHRPSCYMLKLCVTEYAVWDFIVPNFPIRDSGLIFSVIKTSRTLYLESIPNIEERKKPNRG